MGADGKPLPSAKTARADSVAHRTLLADDAPVRVHVPTDDSLERRWVYPDFDDGAWTKGKGGVGYENGQGYAPLIGVDIGENLFEKATSAYVRYTFDFPKEAKFDRVSLRLKFEDGFIAYINGDPVAKQNSGLLPSWDSASRDHRLDTDAVKWSTFDITDSKDRLQEGRNLLAVQIMNDQTDSSDLLLVSEVRLEQDVPGTVIKVDPNARLTARVLAGDEWSPPYRSWKTAPQKNAPASAENVIISEIMYHPAKPSSAEATAGFTEESDFEFLELTNVGAEPIDLAGVYCRDGIHFMVSNSAVIPPAGCAVIARNPKRCAAVSRPTSGRLFPWKSRQQEGRARSSRCQWTGASRDRLRR